MDFRNKMKDILNNLKNHKFLKMCDCKCSPSRDVRARCDPKLHNKYFLKCGARIDTALFHLENDYKTNKVLYEAIEEGKNIYPIFRDFLQKFNMTKQDIMKVIELFKENYEKDEEEEEEKEEKEEEEEEETMMKCFDCKIKGIMRLMYYKNDGYFCKDCYFNMLDKEVDAGLKNLKKPSVKDVLKNTLDQETIDRISKWF